MDFLTKIEYDSLKGDIKKANAEIDAYKNELAEEIKDKWVKEINDFFSKTENGDKKKVIEKKPNFWKRLKYLFSGKMEK